MEFTNRLIKETSPYLQEHAHNPVDWYTWGSEAIQKAERENKPILLSIGYSACHWCHVMADESFADLETAKLMNDLFVNIKVDREERPDLDKIYQTAHAILSQQTGGWPLTVFLTPDLTPFFSGTYFPKEDRYQLPSFKKVLVTIAQIYQKDFAKITQQNAELRHILQNQNLFHQNQIIEATPIDQALMILQKNFDAVHGGFGGAPKFPQAPILTFLIQQKSEMVFVTLKKMAYGGIYDQIGGGFFRYTVDDQWQIPHFEKMLTDNGQLLYLYAQAYALTNDQLYAQIASEVGKWALTMQDPLGGFYGSIDADSEGLEGKFYVWDRDEIKNILDFSEYEVIEKYFGLNDPANFESHWHFIRKTADTEPMLTTAKEKLLVERAKRIAPFVDKKILVAANSLMIKGLLRTGRLLRNPKFIQSADSALHFIETNLWHNHCLYTATVNGQPDIKAYLDDYVFLIDALLESLQTKWHTPRLNFILDLIEALYKNFADADNGFYFTSIEHEKVIYRPKSFLDDSLPSGNGVLIQMLIKLGHLLGETRYLNTAEKMLQTVWPHLTNYPTQHASSVLALTEFINPTPIIILQGQEDEMETWRQTIPAAYENVFLIPSEASSLPTALSIREAKGKISAYICQGTTCSARLEDLTAFQKVLKSL